MEHQKAVIRIYSSELECIADETADHADIETGGSLYGLWSDRGNPTIHLATRPGPAAGRHVTLFEQDADFHRNIEALVLRHFGVQAVGLWHSHHQLGLPELSGGDLRRAQDFSRRSGRVKFSDILSYFDSHHRPEQRRQVCVKPHVYVDATSGRQAPTRFEVIPGASPIRATLLRIVPREYRAALERPPRRLRTSIRLETSMVMASRHREDAPHETPLATVTEPPSPTTEPPPIEAAPEPTAPTRSVPGPRPADPVPLPASETPVEDRYGVADYDRFLRHLERLLARVELPASIACTVDQLYEGGPVVLTLEAPHDMLVHDVELALIGGELVAIRHRVRDAGSPDPKELLVTEVGRAEDSVRAAIESFRKFGSV